MESPPELSPDTQYLLASRTASLPVLVDAIISEELPFLVHLFSILLRDPRKAQMVARDVISRAVNDADQYPSELTVRAWIVSVVLDELNRFLPRRLTGKYLHKDNSVVERESISFLFEDENEHRAILHTFNSLPIDLQVIVLSRFLFEIPVEQIYLLKPFDKDDGQDLVRKIEALFIEPGRTLQFVEAAFLRLFPPPKLSPNDIEDSTQVVLQRVKRHDRRRRVVIQVQSVAWVFFLLAVFGGIFWWNEGNRVNSPENPDNQPPPVVSALLAPPPTPTPISLENVFYGGMVVEPIPNIARRFAIPEEEIRDINRIPEAQDELPDNGLYLPVPDLSYPDSFPYPGLLQPLPVVTKSQINPEQVAHLLATSDFKWKSAWMDIQYLDYTYWLPNNRAIPTRTQIWVVQPDRSLEITGFTPAKPQERNIILKNRHYFTLIEPDTTIMTSFQPEDHVLVFDLLFREMVFPGRDRRFLRSGGFHNLDVDRVAGSKVIVADWFNDDMKFEYRIWIDSQTGVILRLQQFSPYTQELLNERLVTDITYDYEISASFFDPRHPWDGGFALDETGVGRQESVPLPTPTFALPAP